MIKKVKEHIIGGYFEYEHEIYKIVSFPTRSMVCGENVYISSGSPSSGKFSIKNIKYISTQDVHRLLNELKNNDVDDSLFFDENGSLNMDLDISFEEEN